MKFENTEVFNFEGALRGMRNPLESWNKGDSWRCVDTVCCRCPNENSCKEDYSFSIGKNDMELAQKLIRAGQPHRKFLRQILVSVDITAPLYWWKEFDTYKVGTVANSESTMHRLANTFITLDCFEMDDFKDFYDLKNMYTSELIAFWAELITRLENLRKAYLETKDKRYWKELIRLLPESWLQKRTVTMNYENILNMIEYRKEHKLTEWSKAFIDWTKSLPYSQEFLFL